MSARESELKGRRSANRGRRFRAVRFDWASFLGTGATGLATLLIIAILGIILGNIVVNGLPQLTWRFVSTGTASDMFDVRKAGIFPMIFGTTARVILMTIFVLPAGVLTAIYLTEYARMNSAFTRIIRGAVNNLAGVPSIVFGLFGAGFFVRFHREGTGFCALPGEHGDDLGATGVIVGLRYAGGDDFAGRDCGDRRSIARDSSGITGSESRPWSYEARNDCEDRAPAGNPGDYDRRDPGDQPRGGRGCAYFVYRCRPTTWPTCPSRCTISSWISVTTFLSFPPNLPTWTRHVLCFMQTVAGVIVPHLLVEHRGDFCARQHAPENEDASMNAEQRTSMPKVSLPAPTLVGGRPRLRT